MIVPFLAPYLAFLEIGIVFYMVVALLAVVSLFCLPGDVRERASDEWPGCPPLAVLFNILMYAIVIYHYGIDISSWTHWLPLLGVYILVGVLWSSAKWVSLCRTAREALKVAIEKATANVPDAVDKLLKQTEKDRLFMKNLFDDNSVRKYQDTPYIHDDFVPWERDKIISVFIPQVSAHKAQVLIWILCWPLSMIKWALADALRDIANGIFNAIRGWFQKIAASTFSNV